TLSCRRQSTRRLTRESSRNLRERLGMGVGLGSGSGTMLFQYPPSMTALDRISVTEMDLLRTQEGEFLNDSLVDLYLK
ncbi:unnamed protein product, partial [Choristocarpus tenellus]